MDKLVHYVNLNTSIHKVNMLYSTQADYAAARIASAQPLALKTSDAFPYSSSPHEVWSGYFASRPGLKGFVRTSSVLFAAARQLQAWAARPVDTSPTNPLWLLETGLGVAQHHDAVSGTSKQVVADDYARRLQAGRDAASAAMSGWASALLGLGASKAPAAWAACDLANATICAPTEALGGAAVALFLYNAQAQARDGATLRVPVRLGAGAASWAVLAADGATPVAAQLVPSSPADQRLRTAYYGAAAANMSLLAFRAPSVPAAGYTLLFLQPVASVVDAPLTFASEVREVLQWPSADTALSNGIVTLGFDAASGQLSSFTSTAAGVPAAANLSQTLLYYSSNRGDNVSNVNSGAYIFRPNSTQTAFAVAAAGPVALSLVSGPVVSEAWQTFAPWASQVVRLWANATDRFELEITAGPLPIELLEGQGRELVSRVSVAGWATASVFATDSNGREWQRRVRNARPDYPYTIAEPVAGNFFPVNTAARLVDGASGASLTVLTDRTQAGASLADGELELMVHRRLTADDEKGVMEDLNEPGVNGAGLVVRGTHTLLLSAGAGAGGNAARAHRAAMQDALLPLVLRVAPLPTGQAPAAWVAGVAASASLLASPLPANVQLLTLHAWNATTALLRLAHLFEVGEDAAMSGNATVSLAALFSAASGMRVTAAVEMTLTGGQPLADVAPITYRIATGGGGGGGGGGGKGERETAAEAMGTLVSAEERSAMLAALTTRERRAFSRGLADAPWRQRPRRGIATNPSTPDVVTVTLPIVPPPPQGPGLEVTLTCMQVRTFLITLA